MNDLISRTELMKALDKKCTRYENHLVVPGWWTAMKVIAEQPTVNTVEGKEARWKGEGFGDYSCSLCGEIVTGNEYNYCPNCWAYMKGD